MRKIYIILISIVLFSCTDELTQLPSNRLPADESIKTVSDLGIAVNGIYSSLVNEKSYCGNYGLYADAKGGELEYLRNYGHLSPVINLQTDANSNEAKNFFSSFYVASYRINDVLNAVKVNPIDGSNTDEYKHYIAQLHALRALFHFELLRIYCPLPSVATNMDAPKSGIVLSDSTYHFNKTFSRSTLNESYDFVDKELKEALKGIKKITTPLERTNSIGYINYWTVKALQARFYLYREEYQKALDAAKAVLNDSDNPYSLLTIDNYMDSWREEGADETLLEIRTSDLDNAQKNSIGYYTDPDGYPEGTVSSNFKTFYDALPINDVRKGIIAEQATKKDNKFKAFYCQKYKGRTGEPSPLYVNNPKIIRLVELYYIAAEAVLKGATGGQTAAFYLNKVKKNRIKGYTDVATVTIDDILADRRIELYCENSRMFDLVRYKRTIDHPVFSTPIQPTDPKLLVNWPQRELEINPEF